MLYVPNLKKNLVSISAMEDKGLKVAFVDGKVHVRSKTFVIHNIDKSTFG